jgi:hypothetical protein
MRTVLDIYIIYKMHHAQSSNLLCHADIYHHVLNRRIQGENIFRDAAAKIYFLKRKWTYKAKTVRKSTVPIFFC